MMFLQNYVFALNLQETGALVDICVNNVYCVVCIVCVGSAAESFHEIMRNRGFLYVTCVPYSLR